MRWFCIAFLAVSGVCRAAQEGLQPIFVESARSRPDFFRLIADDQYEVFYAKVVGRPDITTILLEEEGEDSRYRVRHRIFQYRIEADPDSADQPPRERERLTRLLRDETREIDSSLAVRIKRIWMLELLEVSYRNLRHDPFTIDGADYYFGSNGPVDRRRTSRPPESSPWAVETVVRSDLDTEAQRDSINIIRFFERMLGQVYSPPEGSRAARFRDLGESLKKYADGDLDANALDAAVAEMERFQTGEAEAESSE